LQRVAEGRSGVTAGLQRVAVEVGCSGVAAGSQRVAAGLQP
jgi:hypothetical protein